MTRISRIVLSTSLFLASLVWLSIVDPNVPLRALFEDFFRAPSGATALISGAGLFGSLMAAVVFVEAASALVARAWIISPTESGHGKPTAGVF